MILHTPDTISIRRYAKFEKSKDLRVLFRLPVPKWYALKYSGQFITSFNSLFSGNSEDKMNTERLKLLAQNKIMLMQALLMGVQMHLGEKIQLEMLRPGYDMHLQIDPILVKYISDIEVTCGIKIESINDIIAFRDEIERKSDKYAELFPEKEQKQGVSILQLAFSVFSIMNMPFDGSMSLTEFAELKQFANERSIKMQESIDKSNGRD